MIRFLVRNSTTVFLALIGILFFGMVAYSTLPRESSPDITIPVVMITTPYRGVAPADIEGLVTIPIENELSSLRDVKEMRSTSAEGVSIVSLEFEPDVVIEDALQRVRDRVNRAKPNLPGDVDEPAVREISFSDIPMLLITLAGADETELKQAAEDLGDQITRVSGVLDAKISGGLTRQVRVQVFPDRLSHFSLQFNDIIGAIRDENVNVPGGEIPAGDSSLLLRVPGEFVRASQVEDVAMKRVGDRPVFVRDVARVVDGFEDRQTYSRMNGIPAVTVSVTKRAGANILEVAEQVKALVAADAEGWSEGMSYRVLADESRNIRNMVSELQNGILTALILVMAVVLAFMGVRSSLFVGFAIPMSMLMSFLVLQTIGFTLNFIVLFSLILALGMLVDNAIVIIENIYRHIELGMEPEEAAIAATNEVGVAVAASTATTVAAFLPMVLWTGIMGEFMGYLPKTVIIVLICSLVVAVLFLPVLTARLLSRKKGVAHVDSVEIKPVDPVTLNPLVRGYYRVLQGSIRFRYLSVTIGVALLLGTFGVYAVFNHGVEFFPDTQPDKATVGVRMPEGTDVEATDSVVRRLERILASEPNVDVYVSEVGVSGDGDALVGAQSSPHEARISVDFLPAAENAVAGDTVRHEDTNSTIERLREQMVLIPGAAISVEKQRMGPPVGDPVSVEVSGQEFHQVGAFAQQVRRDISKIEDITELSDNYRVGRPELRLNVDRGAAKRVGVSTNTVGNTVRTAVAGAKASSLRDGEDDVDIVVELAPEFRADLQSVLSLRLPGREDTSPDTFPVPVSSVASYELAGGSGAIQHVDQNLVVTISGGVTHPDKETEVREDVKAFIAAYERPNDIGLRLGGAADEQEASAAFLSWAFGVAVLLILMVLVAQFNSISMPAVILFTVVLSQIGVLWGLLLTGTPFGIIMTGIGIISLAGVVVNNAIVLLDYVERLREKGLSMEDSLLLAGITRFRPVMLTAITTTLGLVPMATGINIDFGRMRLLVGTSSSTWWGPMAVAVIFGLSFATVLTLVMVPTLYSIREDFQLLVSRIRAAMSPRSTAAAATMLIALGVGMSPSAEAVTLREAMAAAEENNLDLQILHETTVQTETFRGQALSALSPRLVTGASWNLNQTEVEMDFGPSALFDQETLDQFSSLGFELPEAEPIVVQPKQYFDAAFTVSQPLFNGQALPLYNGARDLARAARLDEVSQRQRVMGGVARAYYGLLTARQGMEVAQLGVDNAVGQLDLAQRQVQAGLADPRAAIQGELALARAHRDLLGGESQLGVAEEAFYRATGLPRDSVLELPDAFSVPATLDEAVAGGTNRADLAAMAFRTRVVKREKTAKTMEWFPSLDGNFSYVFSQNSGFIGEEWQWRLSIQARWTLWDGGLRLAQGREVSSKLRQARLVERRQQDIVTEEIRGAWERLQRAERALQSMDSEVELAQKNRELAERGFQAGSVTWLEVEQAELALQGARLAEINERMNRDLSAIDLNIAVGTL